MKYIKFSSAIIFASVCFFPNVNVYAAEFCSVAQAALSKNQLTLSLQHQIIASSERVFQSQHINGPKLDLLADLSTRNAQQGRAGLLKEGTLALSYNQTLYDSGTADLLALQAQENRKLLKMDLIATEQNSIVDA
ncbi:MAG: hypothetical protein HRU28_01720, partial [Rhizobiales bacterium]|nr:hypothetical protein [Hyphomicrobiales bacterium]